MSANSSPWDSASLYTVLAKAHDKDADTYAKILEDGDQSVKVMRARMIRLLMDKSDPLPVPRIEVYQYNGYNGGFAVSRKLWWKCDIINAKGEREDAGGPVADRGNAFAHAQTWKDRTGWPVFDVGRYEERDDRPRG